jgi:DNA-binding MarR family transcriptional regulator
MTMTLDNDDATAEGTLGVELLEQVGALRRALRRATAPNWLAGGLTGAQLELLRLVRREPGLSVREAAARLRLAPNTVSTLIRQVSDAGLVRRQRDTEDRRVARLVLTDEAARTLNARRDERTAALLTGLDRLAAEDRVALEAALPALGRLAAALDRDDRDA